MPRHLLRVNYKRSLVMGRSKPRPSTPWSKIIRLSLLIRLSLWMEMKTRMLKAARRERFPLNLKESGSTKQSECANSNTFNSFSTSKTKLLVITMINPWVISKVFKRYWTWWAYAVTTTASTAPNSCATSATYRTATSARPPSARTGTGRTTRTVCARAATRKLITKVSMFSPMLTSNRLKKLPRIKFTDKHLRPILTGRTPMN